VPVTLVLNDEHGVEVEDLTGERLTDGELNDVIDTVFRGVGVLVVGKEASEVGVEALVGTLVTVDAFPQFNDALCDILTVPVPAELLDIATDEEPYTV